MKEREESWKSYLDRSLGDDTNASYLDMKPQTRHECWFLINTLSNLALLEQIGALREELKTLKDNGKRDTLKL